MICDRTYSESEIAGGSRACEGCGAYTLVDIARVACSRAGQTTGVYRAGFRGRDPVGVVVVRDIDRVHGGTSARSAIGRVHSRYPVDLQQCVAACD
jgi:hypothetical protein